MIEKNNTLGGTSVDKSGQEADTDIRYEDGIFFINEDVAGVDEPPLEEKVECEGYRIRKLTPKECWRLMGFGDSDFEKAKNAGISNSQLYKMAGNSIVVDVLYYIFVELYKAMPYLFDDLKLSSFFSGIGAFESALDRLYESINTGNFISPQAE